MHNDHIEVKKQKTKKLFLNNFHYSGSTIKECFYFDYLLISIISIRT